MSAARLEAQLPVTSVRWPAIDAIAAMAPLAPGYRFELLQRSEVAALIGAIAQWYPDISVGSASCFLREDFYTEKVFLAGETERDFIVILFKRDDELAGMLSIERDCEAMTLYGRLGIIAPVHRGAHLSLNILQVLEPIGQAMEMGFVYGMATLKVPHIQVAFERLGYRLLGFTPGFDRELVAPGIVKRVYEAIYAKVLVPEEDLLRPTPENLTPKTRALFELLFPG